MNQADNPLLKIQAPSDVTPESVQRCLDEVDVALVALQRQLYTTMGYKGCLQDILESLSKG